MKKFPRHALKAAVLFLAFLALPVLLAGTYGIFASSAEASLVQFFDEYEYVEGEIIVVICAPYEANFSVRGIFDARAFSQALESDAEVFAERHRLRTSQTFSEIAQVSSRSILHLASDYKSTEDMLLALSSDPSVVSVSRNYIIRPAQTRPNDPKYGSLWGMENIGMPKVWHYHATGSRDVVVAVFDSGINHNHPDLKANMATDSFGNHGRSFRGRMVSEHSMDEDGHGTHVAGIIGAEGNNATGVVGVNWQVSLLAVRVLHGSPAQGHLSNVIDGINYVLSEKNNGMNIRVVNMSFGGWMSPQTNNSAQAIAIKALSDAGIITVMAVGNDNQNLNNPIRSHAGQRHYPSSFRFNNTIAVGAINSKNARSSYSNFGNQWVDIAAPGDGIYSTHLGDGYMAMSGSSMAAPHVAGAAALLAAYSPEEPPSHIRARILHAARNIGVVEEFWADGTLDVFGAISIPHISVPWITEQPESQTADPGSTVSFSVTATDTALYWDYQWQRSNNGGAVWNDIQGATSRVYSMSAQVRDNNAQFRVVVSNDYCRVISRPVTLTVLSTGGGGGSSGGCNSGYGLIALIFVGVSAFAAKKKK